MMPTFGDLLSRATGLYREHVLIMLAIAAVTVATLPVKLVAPGLDILLVVADFLVYMIASGALIRATAVAAEGGVPSFGDSYGRVMDRLSTLLAAFLRTLGAAVGLALTIVGIPFAVRLLVRWYLAPQAVVITNMNAKEGISYSCALLADHWWRTAGYLLLTLIPGLIVTAMLVVWSPGELASALARGAFSVLISPLIAAFWTLLFLDLSHQIDYRSGVELAVSPSEVL